MNNDIANQPFDKRLAYGRETEDKVLFYIQGYFDEEAFVKLGHDKKKDIVCPTTGMLFEVKDQRNGEKYGSVFVELFKVFNGKDYPTKLSTTGADFWVWYVQDKYYVIKTDKLKEIIVDKELRSYTHIDGEKRGKILPITELKDNCDFIWDAIN
jgi:hypothetical protein